MDLGELTGAERRLWAAFPRGDRVDLGGPADPDEVGDWPPDRCVRGEVITRLLLGMVDPQPGYTAGLVLAGARVTGQIELTGATVGYALRLERCLLDEPVQANNAKVRAVALAGCRLPAFYGWEMEVDGRLSFVESTLRHLALGSATITGRLHLTRATLTGGEDRPFVATKLTATQSVLCQRLTAYGEVRLLDAQVGGALMFAGARLSNPDGDALNLEGVHVAQSVYCDQGFTAEGGVRLNRVRVASQFLLDARIAGTLDLRDAQIQTIRVSSAVAGPTRLDGLVYADLKPDESAVDRLRWVRQDPDGYRAQPYEQLAAHYRRLGHDEQARRVLLAKRRAYRGGMPPRRRVWGLVMDALAGYGYAPGRALLWLVAAWLAGWWYFAADGRYPRDPALYALDVLVPTAPLGLESGYTPPGAGLWVSVALQVLGWALSLAVLPALTRALNRG